MSYGALMEARLGNTRVAYFIFSWLLKSLPTSKLYEDVIRFLRHAGSSGKFIMCFWNSIDSLVVCNAVCN